MTDLSPHFPRGLDPVRLQLVLEDAGWRLVGGREGEYARLRPPGAEGDTRSSLLIPLDQRAIDYSALLAAAIRSLESTYSDLWTRTVLPLFSSAPADAFRFLKETRAPRGLIAWGDGQDLIDAARATLVAGAKSYMEPARHFSNRFGKFAKRYMDTVLMGQTAPGSYVVTAYAPADAKVPIRGGVAIPLGYEGIDVATGRQVTQAVVQALEGTAQALADFRETRKLDGFESGVARGVSYDLTTAVRDLARESAGALIVVTWNATHVGDREPAQEARFEFSPEDVSVLNKAAVLLGAPPAAERYVAVGRVHLLTKKEAGGPGVVGIDDGKRKFRVRLDAEEDYHKAVVAHGEEMLVEIAGELSREGNINWLYDARLRRVLTPLQSIQEGLPADTLFGEREDNIPLDS